MSRDNIKIDGLFFSYGPFPIFEDFGFAAAKDVVVFVGPSGCGKTTLLKLISGMLAPSGIRNLVVPRQRCLILQEDSLLPWLSGRDNIEKLLRFSHQDVVGHPMYPLVADYYDQMAFTMSYGQRRLLELFRAILFKPPLLCLDEPLNFLDPSRRRLVVEHLGAGELSGTQLVVATHHLEELDGLDAERLGFDGEIPIKSLKRL